MSNIYTIELTDVEKKALEWVAITADFWIQTAVHERCRIAIEEMVQEDIKVKLNAGLPISGTKEEMVLASTLPSAQERHNEALAQMAAGPGGTPPG
jgi:hypothetical protein